MKNIHTKKILILSLLLIGFVLIPAPATATDLSQEECEIEAEDNDDFSIWDLLWSETEPNTDLNDTDREEMGACEAIVEERDWIWVNPPELPQNWNDVNHLMFEADLGWGADTAGSDDESIVPDTVFASDGAWEEGSPHIRDAYVDVGTVDPATLVHTQGDDQIRYISDDATMYGILDYRTDSSTYDGDYLSNMNIIPQGSSVNYVHLYDGDGDRITEADDPSHAWSADFSDLDTDTNEIEVEAEIEVDLNKEYEHRYQHTHDNSTHWHTELRDKDITRTYTVYNTYNVNVYDSEEPTAKVAEMPDGSMELEIDVRDDGIWNAINTPTDERVTSGWDYYSHQRYTWLRFEVHDGGWSWWGDTANPPIRIAETNTFFDETGVGTSTAQISIEDTDGVNYNAPELQENVVVDAQLEEYNAPETIRITYPEYDEEDWTVEGTVENVEDDIEITETQTVEEANIEIEINEVYESDEEAEVSILLTDEDGNGIHTDRAELGGASDNEYIEINDETYDTNLNGEVNNIVVDYGQLNRIVVDYNSAEWHEFDGDAYTETTKSDSATVEGTPIQTANDVIMFALYGFGPFLIALYLLDKGLALGLWPPWKIFDWLAWK